MKTRTFKKSLAVFVAFLMVFANIAVFITINSGAAESYNTIDGRLDENHWNADNWYKIASNGEEGDSEAFRLEATNNGWVYVDYYTGKYQGNTPEGMFDFYYRVTNDYNADTEKGNLYVGVVIPYAPEYKGEALAQANNLRLWLDTDLDTPLRSYLFDFKYTGNASNAFAQIRSETDITDGGDYATTPVVAGTDYNYAGVVTGDALLLEISIDLEKISFGGDSLDEIGIVLTASSPVLTATGDAYDALHSYKYNTGKEPWTTTEQYPVYSILNNEFVSYNDDYIAPAPTVDGDASDWTGLTTVDKDSGTLDPSTFSENFVLDEDFSYEYGIKIVGEKLYGVIKTNFAPLTKNPDDPEWNDYTWANFQFGYGGNGYGAFNYAYGDAQSDDDLAYQPWLTLVNVYDQVNGTWTVEFCFDTAHEEYTEGLISEAVGNWYGAIYVNNPFAASYTPEGEDAETEYEYANLETTLVVDVMTGTDSKLKYLGDVLDILLEDDDLTYSYSDLDNLKDNISALYENAGITVDLYYPNVDQFTYFKNVALGKGYYHQLTAFHDSYPDTSMKELTDGVIGENTYSSANYNAQQSTGKDRGYTVVDLGEVYDDITNIQVYKLGEGSSGIRKPNVTSVEASIDGINWFNLGGTVAETVYQGSGAEGALSTFIDTVTFEDEAFSARYVRINYTPTSNFVFLTEIKVNVLADYTPVDEIYPTLSNPATDVIVDSLEVGDDIDLGKEETFMFSAFADTTVGDIFESAFEDNTWTYIAAKWNPNAYEKGAFEITAFEKGVSYTDFAAVAIEAGGFVVAQSSSYLYTGLENLYDYLDYEEIDIVGMTMFLYDADLKDITDLSGNAFIEIDYADYSEIGAYEEFATLIIGELPVDLDGFGELMDEYYVKPLASDKAKLTHANAWAADYGIVYVPNATAVAADIYYNETGIINFIDMCKEMTGNTNFQWWNVVVLEPVTSNNDDEDSYYNSDYFAFNPNQKYKVVAKYASGVVKADVPMDLSKNQIVLAGHGASELNKLLGTVEANDYMWVYGDLNEAAYTDKTSIALDGYYVVANNYKEYGAADSDEAVINSYELFYNSNDIQSYSNYDGSVSDLVDWDREPEINDEISSGEVVGFYGDLVKFYKGDLSESVYSEIISYELNSYLAKHYTHSIENINFILNYRNNQGWNVYDNQDLAPKYFYTDSVYGSFYYDFDLGYGLPADGKVILSYTVNGFSWAEIEIEIENLPTEGKGYYHFDIQLEEPVLASYMMINMDFATYEEDDETYYYNIAITEIGTAYQMTGGNLAEFLGDELESGICLWFDETPWTTYIDVNKTPYFIINVEGEVDEDVFEAVTEFWYDIELYDFVNDYSFEFEYIQEASNKFVEIDEYGNIWFDLRGCVEFLGLNNLLLVSHLHVDTDYSEFYEFKFNYFGFTENEKNAKLKDDSLLKIEEIDGEYDWLILDRVDYTVALLRQQFTAPVNVYDDEGNDVTDDELLYIGTGFTVEGGENTFKVILYGDANSDGKITYLDYIKTRYYLLDKPGMEVEMDDAQLRAISTDLGVANYLAYIRIKLHVFGEINITDFAKD